MKKQEASASDLEHFRGLVNLSFRKDGSLFRGEVKTPVLTEFTDDGYCKTTQKNLLTVVQELPIARVKEVTETLRSNGSRDFQHLNNPEAVEMLKNKISYNL